MDNNRPAKLALTWKVKTGFGFWNGYQRTSEENQEV